MPSMLKLSVAHLHLDESLDFSFLCVSQQSFGLNGDCNDKSIGKTASFILNTTKQSTTVKDTLNF